MAKIVKARCCMCAPIDPVEVIPKGIEDPMDLAVAERLPQPPTSAANEERGVGRRRYVVHTLSPVARQRVDRAGMQWQLAGLGKLGLPHDQHPAFEVDVGIA